MTAPTAPRRTPWAARLFRVGLRLYPLPIRRRYGEEMQSMFEAGWRDTSGPRRLRLCLRSYLGLVVNAVLLRLERGPERRAAAFGLAPGTRRVHRRAGTGLGGNLGHDFRVGLRSLVTRPGLTAVVVLTITLGVGVNVSIFSFVNGLLLRPLPYGDPHRLLQLTETAPDIGSMDVSYEDFRYWHAETEVFAGMFAFDDSRFLLTGSEAPSLVEGAVVTPGFLDVLRVTPVLGRDFLEEEGRPGSSSAVILGYSLWRDRFGADSAVLGTTLVLNGAPRTIVGVAPVGFRFPEVADLWIPLALDPRRTDPNAYDFDVIGRLEEGRSLGDAREEGGRIASELSRLHPDTKAEIGADAYPLRAADVPITLAGAALVLLAAVCLVLLIACVNVTHLLLARGEERSREMAVRSALGASRGALLRQLLVESLLLAALGGTGGLAVALGSSRLFPSLLPDEVPFWLSFELDWRVLAWATIATLLACLVMGLAPALRASRRAAIFSSSAATFRSRDRARRSVVVVEVALALMLLIGAGLMLRALLELQAVEAGIDPERVLVLSVLFPPGQQSTEEHATVKRETLQREIVDSVTALPGVLDAAATTTVPLLSSAEEVALDSDQETVQRSIATLAAVTERYFGTMGIPLLAGRLPTRAEIWDGAPIVVVSQSVANRLWPGADAIGRRLRHGVPGAKSPTLSADRPWLTVVGVVGDVRVESLSQSPRQALYVPFGVGSSTLTLVIKTSGEPMGMVEPVRHRIREIDADLPLLQPTTMREAVAFSTWTERLAALLLSAFGGLALVLALVGIHGVVAFTARRRQREIGIRIALGGTPSAVSRAVASETASAVVLGLLLGALGGLAASRALSSLLYGVEPGDPTTLAAATLLLGAAGVLAGYLPARRAAAADPSAALRSE